MAYDKVVDSAVLDAGLKQIADAIREKAGTSGNLAFPAAMAEAIAAIEAGGASGISFGVYTPATTGYNHTIEHGLGTIPKIFAICCGTYSSESSKTYMLDSAHGFSDRNLVCRLSRTAGTNAPSGYISTNVSITQPSFLKNTALAKANSDNISVGGNYQLFAGFEYYWFALA